MSVNKRSLCIILAISALILASLACGSSNEGVVVTPKGDEPSSEEAVDAEGEPVEESEAEDTEEIEESSQSQFDVHEVGDLIEVKEHIIRLNSVEYQGTVLSANFTIENNGSSDLAVSSIISFSAKKGDGTLLDQEIFDCGTSFDGSVLPGDKLRGDICWSGAKPEDEIKLYYEASFLSQGAVVWNAIEGAAQELDTGGGAPTEVQVFTIGEIVEVDDHTIRLNSLEYQGNVLVANISLLNIGDSDINASSMLSFSAKKGDGTKLEQEIFDCGTSMDGSVLPGDRLRGDICWSGASPEDGIKIYYEANFLGEGAIVWEAIEGVADPEAESGTDLKVEMFSVGDVIQVEDHTVILNSAEIAGNVVKANFTVDNLGSSDLAVSSLLSFYAKTPDGTKLEQEIFDCGTSLDGSVLPGDKLRGDICWSGLIADQEIKLYYESDLFGKGAMVWVVE